MTQPEQEILMITLTLLALATWGVISVYLSNKKQERQQQQKNLN